MCFNLCFICVCGFWKVRKALKIRIESRVSDNFGV